MKQIRLCQNCGDEFTPNSGPQKHCSEKCRRTFSQRGLQIGNFNHKIDYIILLDEYSDVWDIEVEDNHNFVVHGVVVHNCYKDNLKRFGIEKTKSLCGVLKDVLRQNVYWRGKAGHSKVPDVGAPGVAIAYADKVAANPPWHGGNNHLSESNLDMGDMAVPEDICLILEDIGKQCDPYRLIVGLDSAPHPTVELEELIL